MLRELRRRIILAFEKEGIPLGISSNMLIMQQKPDPTACHPPLQRLRRFLDLLQNEPASFLDRGPAAAGSPGNRKRDRCGLHRKSSPPPRSPACSSVGFRFCQGGARKTRGQQRYLRHAFQLLLQLRRQSDQTDIAERIGNAAVEEDRSLCRRIFLPGVYGTRAASAGCTLRDRSTVLARPSDANLLLG